VGGHKIEIKKTIKPNLQNLIFLPFQI